MKQYDKHMCFVYRLPHELSDGFCFGGGKPITFLNVDWFGTETHLMPGDTLDGADLISYIKQKRYYDPTKHFLVLKPMTGEALYIEPETKNAN